MTEKEIRKIVRMTVEEIKRKRNKGGEWEENYKYIGGRIKRYYKNGDDKEIEKALEELKEDKYFDVIYQYYKKEKTLIWIAVKMECDKATIARNKKRLAMEIYEKVTEKDV